MWIQPPKPHRRSRTKATLAVIVAAGLGMVALAMLRVDRSSPDQPRAPKPPGGSRRFTALPPDTRPQVRLDDLQWENYHGLRLPVSATDGPRWRAQGLAVGFTPTPRGALLAALHIAVRSNSQWGPGVFEFTVRRQVTGPHAAALLATCIDNYTKRRDSAGATSGAPLGTVFVIEEGFRWESWGDGRAVLDVLTAGPGEQPEAILRIATRVEVVWVRNDWKVVAPSGGDWGSAAMPVTDTSPFTIFPGVR